MGVCIVWPVYNLAHVYNRETPRFSVFDPHKQCEACRLGVCLVFQGFRSECEGIEERGTVGRRGWHVAEETAGWLPTGNDAAAGAIVREHTCHFVKLTFSLLVSMWIMDSAHIHCQDVIFFTVCSHIS